MIDFETSGSKLLSQITGSGFGLANATAYNHCIGNLQLCIREMWLSDGFSADEEICIATAVDCNIWLATDFQEVEQLNSILGKNGNFHSRFLTAQTKMGEIEGKANPRYKHAGAILESRGKFGD